MVARAEIRQERKSWRLAFPKIGSPWKKNEINKTAALRDSALRCASVQSWLSVTLKCLFIYFGVHLAANPRRHMCTQKTFWCNIAREGAISRSYSSSTNCASALLTVIKND